MDRAEALSFEVSKRQISPSELEKRLHPAEQVSALTDSRLAEKLSKGGYSFAYGHEELFGIIKRVKARRDVCPEGVEGVPSYDIAYEQLKSLRARERQLLLSRKNELTEIGKNEYCRKNSC